MRWLNTTTGFAALIGDQIMGTITYDGTDWTGKVEGGGQYSSTDLEDVKAWLIEQITE